MSLLVEGVPPFGSDPRGPTEASPLLGSRDRGRGDGSGQGLRTAALPAGIIIDDQASKRSLCDREETAIGIPAGTAPEEADEFPDHKMIVRIILILIIAVFVGNADGSIVMATHPIISSEFDAMEDSSWLFTAFGLAGCATQALYGKLSDIFGRKPVLLFSYTVFTLGCIIVGIGQSMLQVIFGRVISGSVSGGMQVIVSILITDLMPIRDVGTWRAHVNIAATTGRALGGPLGGWLVDFVGWRWSFLGQAPPLMLAIVLCWYYIPDDLAKGRNKAGRAAEADADEDDDSSIGTSTGSSTIFGKMRRVDFAGAALMASAILAILLPMEIAGVKVPWSHPAVPALFAAGLVLIAAFVAVERGFAREPILPMALFAKRDVVSCFIVMAAQVSAQVGMMFTVPLYFQVTARVSNTEAGAHLFPAVAGNAVGALVSAALIKRYGKYKWIVLSASIIGSLCYVLLLLRWHGHTNWLESLYIIPGGVGSGVAQTAVFIALQAVTEPEYLAPAISALYLSSGVGVIAGLACTNAVHQTGLRWELDERLLQLGLSAVERAEIISKAVSNVDYIYKVGGEISEAIVASYVKGLWYSHCVSLAFSLSAFLVALPLRERKL